MAGQEVLVQRDGPLAWVVLNRPEKLNAMTSTMLDQFGESLDDLGSDDDVSVVIVRGSGSSFSAGYDLASDDPDRKKDLTPVQDYDKLLGRIKLFERLWDLPKPVIAAVHGYCLAGATQLCVYADITVVAEEAKIGMPAIPSGGGFITPMWSHLIGPKRAKQMAFVAGNQISGSTASDWGWANYAVPEVDLWDDVERLARDIAKVPRDVLRMKKASINRAAEVQGVRTAMALGAETDALLHLTPSVLELKELIKTHGMKEAIKKFKER